MAVTHAYVRATANGAIYIQEEFPQTAVPTQNVWHDLANVLTPTYLLEVGRRSCNRRHCHRPIALLVDA